MYSTVRTVRSADGTMIAYEEVGAGPRLVLIHGSICDRTYWAPVVPALKEHLAVVSVDRRGRGGSGDTAPYAIVREVEDVVAVVERRQSMGNVPSHEWERSTIEAASASRTGDRSANARCTALIHSARGRPPRLARPHTPTRVHADPDSRTRRPRLADRTQSHTPRVAV